ncbi:oligosaccharide flippase family protein [Methylophaga thalassica]|uniref:oligosaccharide flippase family protein n=1 Tax=Methylophaga aminisulfidivorans TaxID=230105 RepID=UPI003A8F7946
MSTQDLDTSSSSLKKKAINSSVWVVVGYGISQSLRLVSNVLLAKLLFPEVFGLMMLVNVFIQGISMFSDLGTGASIIQNKRGADPDFLNTAWTLQIIRGAIIWAIACLSSPIYASIFDEPRLIDIIPIAALSAIVSGFYSTSISSANRNLSLKRYTLMDLSSQFLGVVATLLWVYFSPTVWGLVAGSLVGVFVKLGLSHFLLDGIQNKFRWDKSAIYELFGFGKWIFLSTGVTFLVSQIDRVLFGYFMGTTMLGVYTIAAMFNMVSQNVIQLISNKILFPSFANIARTENISNVCLTLRKTLKLMVLSAWTISVAMMTLGSELIGILYDQRYSDAVWMLKILPLSMLIGVLSMSYQNVILALGHPKLLTILNTTQVLVQITSIICGYYLFGILGLVIGYTFVTWFMYPLNAYLAYKKGIWQPDIDIIFILIVIAFTIFYFSFYSNELLPSV